MKFVYVPNKSKQTKLSPWNRFYKTIQAIKSDKAKRTTK